MFRGSKKKIPWLAVEPERVKFFQVGGGGVSLMHCSLWFLWMTPGLLVRSAPHLHSSA